MLFDAQATFSEAQDITASAASTNYIDLGLVRNIGVGEELYLVLIVTTTFADDSSNSTITPSLQADDNTSFSSPATVRTFDTFAALTAAGTKRVYKLEPFTDAGTFQRYIRLMYTAANGDLSAGAITAFLTKDVQAWTAYAVGSKIS